MNRRASCVGTFEVFEAAHVALRTLLAFSQPVNCIFWPIGMLNWLVAASKLHKHRETCCTAEWPFYGSAIAYARSLMLVLMLMSMLMSHASVNFFVLSFVLPGAYAYFASEDHRIENKQKGHSNRNLCCLCRHACRITHVHYAGSSQSIAFSGQKNR